MRARDGGVDARAALRRAASGTATSCVSGCLKAYSTLRVERLLVEELGLTQRRGERRQRRRRRARDTSRARAPETSCRSPPRAAAPASRAPAADRCAPRAPPARSAGIAKSLDRLDETIRPACALEAARLDQRLHDLLDEERVAAGALRARARRGRDDGIAAEQVARAARATASAPRGRSGSCW